MFTDVRNPKWAGPDKKQIRLEVRFGEGGEFEPFIASPIDCTDYGPKLFNDAAEGKFGPVADSDYERIVRGELPVPEGFAVRDGKLADLNLAETEARGELNRRLAELNTEEAKAMAEIDDEYRAERKAKIAALLAVKNQEGWPLEAAWPEKSK